LTPPELPQPHAQHFTSKSLQSLLVARYRLVLEISANHCLEPPLRVFSRLMQPAPQLLRRSFSRDALANRFPVNHEVPRLVVLPPCLYPIIENMVQAEVCPQRRYHRFDQRRGRVHCLSWIRLTRVAAQDRASLPSSQVQPHDCPHMARGQSGSLFLSLYDSLIHCFTPVYPDAIHSCCAASTPGRPSSV